MKRINRASLAAACALALTASACGSSSTHPSSGGAPKTSSGATTSQPVTLDVESNTLAGPITGGFNPFLTSEDSYGLGAVSMIYEPLIQFDILRPGVTRPWLASAYAWSNGGKTLTFTIRKGVKWQDGTPLTSADVAYTFGLIKAQTALNTNGIMFDSVTAPSPDSVVMSFAAPAYTQLYAIAGQTLRLGQRATVLLGGE
jgi:peptide/nickel transport system substrate-binding protein